jgi:hypothetical protein
VVCSALTPRQVVTVMEELVPRLDSVQAELEATATAAQERLEDRP